MPEKLEPYLELVLEWLQLGFRWLMAVLESAWVWVRQYYVDLPGQEVTLRIISITILIILAFAIVIAVTVLVLRVKNTLKARRWRRLETSWERRLMEIITSDEGENWEPITVKRRDRMFFLQHLYRYSQRLQGEELQRVKALAEPHLPMLTKWIRSGGYPELRARNLNILGVFGFPEYLEEIKEGLNDSSPIVTMAAARNLAHRDFPEHAKIILPEIQLFDHWSMSFLASMLAEMGSGAAPDLREKLRDPNASERTRIACTEALQTIGDLPSADIAAELLDAGTTPELMAALLRLLAEVGTSRHIEAIRRQVNAPDYTVRIHAFASLGVLGGSADGELARAAMDDDSIWVALNAARALHKLDRKDILNELVQNQHKRSALAAQVLTE